MVHNSSWGEHLRTVREVFQKMSRAKPNARPSKTAVGTKAIDFVGYGVVMVQAVHSRTTCARLERLLDQTPRRKFDH